MVTKLIRDASSSFLKTAPNEVNNWIVFDGPVDTLWVENLNSALDDNKILCLQNNEKLKLSKNLAIIFEAEDLKAATPSTLSRCGLVYMNS